MNCNVGIADRSIRVTIGLALLVAWIFSVFSGTLGIVLGVVGIILIATAGLKFCPLYRLFGASTCTAP